MNANEKTCLVLSNAARARSLRKFMSFCSLLPTFQERTYSRSFFLVFQLSVKRYYLPKTVVLIEARPKSRLSIAAWCGGSLDVICQRIDFC